MVKKSTQTHYHERLLRVLKYIECHLDQELSLEELANVAHFSSYHFHRIFKAMVGESLAEYIRRLRLERSAHSLLHTEKSITDVAFDAQYNTVEAFIRAFKSVFGRSPSKFRQYQRSFHVQKSECFNILNGGKTMIDVNVIELPTKKVAYVRNIGPYESAMTAWEKLYVWAKANQAITESTEFFGLCYDDPDVTPPEKIRYDACITVDTDIKPDGEVGLQDVPGGKFASTLHRGPYETLLPVYQELCGNWVVESNYEAKDEPCIEVYLNDPKNTPPDQLLTEIRLPLE